MTADVESLVSSFARGALFGSFALVLAVGVVMDAMGMESFVGLLRRAWFPLGGPLSVLSYAVGVAVPTAALWSERRKR